MLGGEEGKIYLIVADTGSQSGQGLNFISTLPRVRTSLTPLTAVVDRWLRVAPALLQCVRHGQRAGRHRDYAMHGRDHELNRGCRAIASGHGQ